MEMIGLYQGLYQTLENPGVRHKKGETIERLRKLHLEAFGFQLPYSPQHSDFKDIDEDKGLFLDRSRWSR